MLRLGYRIPNFGFQIPITLSGCPAGGATEFVEEMARVSKLMLATSNKIGGRTAGQRGGKPAGWCRKKRRVGGGTSDSIPKYEDNDEGSSAAGERSGKELMNLFRRTACT